MKTKSSVLLIYTGGTIGMMQDPRSGELKPFDFKSLTKQIPELTKFDIELSSISFKKPIDSSNMNIVVWKDLAGIIEKNYAKYDGFVILHGSDTMSYTASALSFMLENLNKPVVLTGSQLPIGVIRTDGKENLITAIEIAGAKEKGKSIVTEVCIYFEYKLYRGNRTFKHNSAHFDAFKSPNYPALAQAGVTIKYNKQALLKSSSAKKLKVHTNLENEIAVIKLFPGISKNITAAIFNAKGIKAIIIETFGAGNATTEVWFLNEVEKALAKGIIILNITQCKEGRVIQGMYETSSQLKKLGVIGGSDLTFESAITKLMFLLGQKLKPNELKKMLQTNLRGEMTS
ncbi:asparaginase [Aurantibacillus circumpalustris]|uniref:asparaginase n=1 Tax=Aurantibacillus circumpalustris TaxID=3036359 RepID=UPI00295AF7D8|nr:type I asparaginase [Aurantibacillus circumpalustris]